MNSQYATIFAKNIIIEICRFSSKQTMDTGFKGFEPKLNKRSLSYGENILKNKWEMQV